MDWDDYRFFLTSARSTSVRAAAITLGVSHSTVLRRLDGLEKRLGTRLFDRRGSGFPLTVAGESVLLGAAEIEESLQAIDRAVTGHDHVLEGSVTVSMPEALAFYSLAQDICDIKAQYPQIKIKIDMTCEVADLAKREADIAIRLLDEVPEGLVGRCVGEVTQAAYATQAYVDEYAPHRLDSKAQWIGFACPQQWLPNSPYPHLDYMGIFDNMGLQLSLAAKGAGIAYLPCPIADTVAGIVRLSEPVRVADLWVLYHADLRSTARISAIRDCFLEKMQQRFR